MRRYAVREKLEGEAFDALKEYPEFLRELLLTRDITSPEAAQIFLEPNYEKGVHDPFLMKGMDRATDRILSAIKNKEHIGLYTDYDCDGNPAAVLLHDFFKKIGYEQFENYIPHRHKEGYGLNKEAIDTLNESGVTLLITADLGITNIEEVRYANTLGMEVIITDHHLPGDELPPAHTILNPKQKDDQYPFDGLCGTGVVFKLIQALLAKGDFDVKPGWEKWWLDMVGLATIADMVPLRDENRIFAHYGLFVMKRSPRLGLMKLCRTIGVFQRNITEDDIGFMIAPRINAASRMGEPMDAFKLLTATDETEADQLAKHLNKINNERKGLVASMTKEIKKRLAHTEPAPVIVLGSVSWRPALLGLSANAIAEEYRRPVFLWGREEHGLLKGSCRSDGSVDLVELMSAASDMFLEFGGHAFSGGFSLEQDKLVGLQDILSEKYQGIKKDVEETVFVDRKLALTDVTWETARMLDKLAPFGEGNPKPLFMFENIELEQAALFGKTKDHLKLSLTDSNMNQAEAIQFFAGEEVLETLKGRATVSFVGHIEVSNFRGKKELRIRIVDFI